MIPARRLEWNPTEVSPQAKSDPWHGIGSSPSRAYRKTAARHLREATEASVINALGIALARSEVPS